MKGRREEGKERERKSRERKKRKEGKRGLYSPGLQDLWAGHKQKKEETK